MTDRNQLIDSIATRIYRGMNWLDEPPDYDIDITTPGASDEGRMFRAAFQAAFRDRISTHSWIVVIIGILLMVDFICGINFNRQLYGLMLDLAGAVALALGLFRGTRGFRSDTKTYTTGTQYGGRTYYHAESVKSEARKTADAVIGVLLLASGFTVQILAVVAIL